MKIKTQADPNDEKPKRRLIRTMKYHGVAVATGFTPLKKNKFRGVATINLFAVAARKKGSKAELKSQMQTDPNDTKLDRE